MKILPSILALALVSAVGAVHASDDAQATSPRILVTFADPGMSSAATAGPSRPGYSRRPSAYLVSVGVKRAASRIARDFDLDVIDEWPIVPLRVHCLVFEAPKSVTVEELLRQLRERPEVESAQLMNRFEVLAEKVSATGDPYAGLQHNLETLELSQAHAWSRGDGTRVTIIDTGADFNHPELRAQIRFHQDFVGSDERAFVSDAHGTAVAGVIAAAANNGLGVVGVAPSASLTVLKACWYDRGHPDAVCDSFTLAKALANAIDSDAHVINLSIGGPSDGLLARLVAAALERDKVIVAAAPQQPGFPSEVPGVIVAGSGAGVLKAGQQLLAPGDEILVPVPGGGFDFASGSSLSAAQVSGIAALLIARQPRLSRADINRLIAGSAVDGQPVNACRALADLLQLSGCRAMPPFEQALNASSESRGQGKDNF